MGCRPQRGGWRELASSCFSWGCPSSCGWASSKDGSRQPCAWRAAWALAALSAFGLLARTSRPAYSQLLVGGGASERGVARAAWCRGRLRDAVHATLPRLQRARPGRLLSAAARWLFDGLRPERVASGVWHLHLRHMGDSRRVRPRRARLYHLSIEGVLPADTAWSVSTGALIGWLTILFLTSARRYLLADARASVSSENGRSGSGVLTEAAATSVAPLVALFFAWSAWPSENLSGVHLASLAVAMALVYLVAYAIVGNKTLL